MDWFESLLLGIIQGLTEFLPISSSAHVQIAQQLLGLSAIPKPQLTAFIATIQLGTEAAVLIYFWRDIVRIVQAFFGALFAKSKQSTDALRDGVDVPGESLRLVVMEGVPWPRPTILHAARRARSRSDDRKPSSIRIEGISGDFSTENPAS